MFHKPVPLDYNIHRQLKVHESNDYAYARAEIFAPITFNEMADIAREYPIVFPQNGSNLPAALLGLEPGENAYVAEDGRWLGTYVPAQIRSYPFAFTRPQEETDPNRFVVLVDTDAPHLRDPNGHPVFDAGGSLSAHMKRRAALLEIIQRATPLTRRLVAAIDQQGLLVEREITIRKSGGKEHQVRGLRVIDEKKLNALPHDAFNVLRDSGSLPLVYAHLLSWANFRQGPLAGKYPDLAAKPKTSNPDFLFESETIDFSRFS